MSADALSEFLRSSFEPLQYAAFFGALVLFGLLEQVVARRTAGPRLRRWSASFSITFLNIMVLGAMGAAGLSLLLAADYAASGARGLLNDPAIPAWAAFVLGLLVRSFASYLVHVANHKVPWMWRVHRLHHTDTEIDISTTARFHPLEFVYSTPIMLVVVLAFGIPPVAIIVFEIVDAAMAVFNHANIRLPSGVNRVLAWVLVTPDVHRVHHSILQKETDSNFGVTVTWWDRLCGTYRVRPTEELATMRLGLEECQDARTTSLSWLLVLPFLRLAPVGAASRSGAVAAASARGAGAG
jgi:sterol desaturase/sphingolipid hydroxylase (fatty acid hydroxylase superfamily)